MDPARPFRPVLGLALVLAAGDALGVAARDAESAPAGLIPGTVLVAFALAGVSLFVRRQRGALWAAALVLLGIALARAASSAGPAEPMAFRPVSRPGLGGLLAKAEARPVLVLPEGVARRGDRIRAVGEPRAWRSARAPGDPPRTQRLDLELEDLDRRPRVRSRAAEVGRVLERLRVRARDRLGELRSDDTRGLALALLIGDRGALPAGRPDLFTRTGTRHLLALSGLHVGLFAWLVVRHLSRAAGRSAGRSRVTIEAVVGAALLLLLAPLAGAGAPVRRACWAGALACLAPIVPSAVHGAGRRVDALSLWSLALALELLASPGASASVGVRLSYTATLGLLLVLPSTLRGRPVHGPPVDSLGRPRARWVAGVDRRLRVWLRTALSASVVAVVATLPVTWTTFGELSLVGPFATPLCLLPLVALVAAGLAWILVPLQVLEPALERCAELSARSMLALLELADRLPGTPLPLPPRPLAWLATSVAALAYGYVRSQGGAPRGGKGWARAGLALLGVALLPWTLAPRGLEVVACDVGHGTAVAARAPGGRVWVFDGGSRDRSGVDRGALGPLLRRWDAGRVTIALSHRHRDHAAALPWLASRWPPDRWLGAPPIEPIAPSTSRLDVGVGRLRDRLRDDLVVGCGRGSFSPGNEGSRHLVLTWRGRSVVLLGDAVEDGLAECIERRMLDGPVDLLLLPHHGGASPHLDRLLAVSRPRRVWASCTGVAAAREAVAAAGLVLETTARDGPLSLILHARKD